MPFQHICPEAVRPWVLVSPVPAWQLYAYGTFSDIQKGRFAICSTLTFNSTSLVL